MPLDPGGHLGEEGVLSAVAARPVAFYIPIILLCRRLRSASARPDTGSRTGWARSTQGASPRRSSSLTTRGSSTHSGRFYVRSGVGGFLQEDVEWVVGGVAPFPGVQVSIRLPRTLFEPGVEQDNA